MKIDKAQVEHVAMLARLTFTEEEKEVFTRQLNQILEYMDKLNELDTRDVQPTFHVLPLRNVFRHDEVRQRFSRDEMMANAPEQSDGFFKVPKVVEA